jgi:hypothetical protein
MNVEELFTKLSHGPLSNLSLANSGDGTIADNSQGKIIDYLNDGLNRLYTKFVLSEKELIIRMIDGITNYYMMSRFSQSGHDAASSDPVYILDGLNPFIDDVIKILQVFGPQRRELPLNDSENSHSLFTPKFNQLQVPRPIGSAPLSVLYQAKHKKIQYGILSQDISLPESLNEPLEVFIASRVFSHMNGQENTLKSQEHYSMYQLLIGENIDNDSLNTSMSNTNTNFERKGWI